MPAGTGTQRFEPPEPPKWPRYVLRVLGLGIITEQFISGGLEPSLLTFAASLLGVDHGLAILADIESGSRP